MLLFIYLTKTYHQCSTLFWEIFSSNIILSTLFNLSEYCMNTLLWVSPPTVCGAEFCRKHHEWTAGLVRLRQGGAKRLWQPGDRGDATAHLCPQRYENPVYAMPSCRFFFFYLKYCILIACIYFMPGWHPSLSTRWSCAAQKDNETSVNTKCSWMDHETLVMHVVIMLTHESSLWLC